MPLTLAAILSRTEANEMSENLWPPFSVPPQPPTIRQTLIDAGEGLAVQTDGKLKLQVTAVRLTNRVFH
jgi:hypothetical protein